MLLPKNCIGKAGGSRQGLHQWASVNSSLPTQLHRINVFGEELKGRGPPEPAPTQLVSGFFSVGSVRFGFPRGTQPKPNYKWDWRALDKIVGGSGQKWDELKQRIGGQFKHYKKDWRTWGTGKTSRYFTYNNQEWRRGEMVPPEVYTPEPLQIPRLGGRDPETGSRINFHISGGAKFDYFLIDWFRVGPNVPGEFYEERVLEVRKDPNRNPYIALVAGTKGKRWILATEEMEAGKIIKTSSYIPDDAVLAQDGDAHPVGALPTTTTVCCVEMFPGRGATNYIAPGTGAVILKKQQGMVVLKGLRNKREFALKPECMVTVGKIGRGDWKDLYYGTGNMHRRFGWRMQSGVKIKKDGYSGRKARAPQPVTFFDAEPELPPETYKVTLEPEHYTNSFGTAASNRWFKISSLEALGEDCEKETEILLPEDVEEFAQLDDFQPRKEKKENAFEKM